MKKLVILIVSIVLSTGTSSAIAGLLFYDDCENQWLVEEDWRVSNCLKRNNKISVSSEQARAGSHSYKMYLQPYNPEQDGASNCGLIFLNLPYERSKPRANFSKDEEYWMGFSFYLPADQRWPDPDVHPPGGGKEWLLLWQFHGMTGIPCDISGLNPPQAAFLDKSAGGYKFTVLGDTAECQMTKSYEKHDSYRFAFSKGDWQDIVLNFKFSDTSSGFFKVWLNETLVVNNTGVNMFTHPYGNYFVLGPYGHMTTGTTVYFDEIRVGDSNSSYEQVAPKGESDPHTPTPPVLNPPYLRIVSGN